MDDIVATTITALGSLFGLDLGQTNLLIVSIGLFCIGSAFHSSKIAARWLQVVRSVGIHNPLTTAASLAL